MPRKRPKRRVCIGYTCAVQQTHCIALHWVVVEIVIGSTQDHPLTSSYGHHVHNPGMNFFDGAIRFFSPDGAVAAFRILSDTLEELLDLEEHAQRSGRVTAGNSCDSLHIVEY